MQTIDLINVAIYLYIQC